MRGDITQAEETIEAREWGKQKREANGEGQVEEADRGVDRRKRMEKERGERKWRRKEEKENGGIE